MLPISYCPDCNYKLDAATVMKGDKSIKPEPGDVSICANYTAFLQFDNNLRLIPIPSIKGLPKELADLLFEARRAIHEVQRERERDRGKQRETKRNREK